ncbi:MAG: hypothetical protein RR549_00610 [Oscillospiraceae bacterium]
MKKHLLKAVSSLVAISLAFSLVGQVSAAGTHQAAIAETRYRYYTASFDGATFTKGKNIDSIKKGIKTDKASDNNENGVFNAIIDSYPLIGSSMNKAIRIKFPNVEKSKSGGIYTCIQINPNDSHNSKRTILNKDQGIPIKSNDHGYMFHIEMKALEGNNQEDGFCYIDDNDNTKITKHYARDINVTFQERDYPNGAPVPDETNDSKPIVTAMNMGENNKITFVWTKDVNFEYEEVKLDSQGKEVKNDKGETVYDKKTMNKKKGDVDFGNSKGGGIIFPRDFCGYVMIPFSSFTLIDGGWKGKDTDGKINLMYLELINFYTGFYQQFKGEMWIDECALYGPTFANVPGAYDVKIDPKNPAARTQSKINIEEKSIEIIDPYGSDDPENNNKSKENTVSQGENSTESDISQEDTLNSDISVDGNGVSALSNE